MADCRFTNFDIAVHGQANPYLVRAVYAEHAAEGELDADRRQPYWAGRLAELGSRRRPPGRAVLEETGARLFQALLHSDVRDLWLRAHADLEGGKVAGLRVRLSLSPAGVVDLPWEAMYDRDRRVFLAASLQTPLVRVVNLLRYVGAVRPLATRLPLRLLVAIPDDPTGQIDAAVEWQRIQDAVAPIRPEGVSVERFAGRFGILELRRQLELGRPDILHLITHGGPEGVVLWQAGQPVIASAAALRVALEAAPSVRLVVLTACATATAPPSSPSVGAASVSEPPSARAASVSEHASPVASVGAQLLQAGLPAVIAMQFDVQEEVAAEFAGYFYTELVAGRCPGAIDVAMSYARSSLYALNPDAFDYGMPVLWLNTADGRIFMLDRTIQARPRVVATPLPAPAPAAMAAILEEIAALQQWLAASTPRRDRRSIDRSIESSRQEHLQSVRDTLAAATNVTADASPAKLAEWASDRLPDLRRHQWEADRLSGILQNSHKQDPPEV